MKLMKSNKLNFAGCRETGFAGGNWFRRRKLVSQGETGFAGGNCFHRGKLLSQGETGYAGGNLFLITLAKIFIIILVVKKITYNAKATEITIL